MPTRRAFVVAAACVTIASPVLAAEPSPRDFVTAIYDAYKGKDARGTPLDDDAAIRRYFEPKLAAAMIKDRRAAKRRQEVGTLDFDPFVDAQDWEIASFDIAVNDTGAGKAIARALQVLTNRRHQRHKFAARIDRGHICERQRRKQCSNNKSSKESCRAPRWPCCAAWR
jgi:hypothetical protein